MEWESDSPCCSHTYPRQGHRPPEGTAAGSWSLGIVEQSPGKGSCWLRRDRSGGCEGGDCGGKIPVEESWAAMEEGQCCWVTCKGWRHHHSLSPPTHASIRSWTIERLAHQMPDALNYRLGRHPACSFKWLMCRTRVGSPASGVPLCAWMGRATEKDWPKRPSDFQL